MRCPFFYYTPTHTRSYTLSLHDALPILGEREVVRGVCAPLFGRDQRQRAERLTVSRERGHDRRRSEEHTSELQSRQYLVCRLLLEKKNPHTPSVHTTSRW